MQVAMDLLENLVRLFRTVVSPKKYGLSEDANLSFVPNSIMKNALVTGVCKRSAIKIV